MFGLNIIAFREKTAVNRMRHPVNKKIAQKDFLNKKKCKGKTIFISETLKNQKTIQKETILISEITILKTITYLQEHHSQAYFQY